MNNPTRPAPDPQRDQERLRRFMALSPAEKLRRLEALNDFLNKLTPAAARTAWTELKKRGW